MLTIWRKENIVQKHKWYNEIVAWASGAIIESKDVATGVWEEVDPYWETDDEYEYRIKPQPKESQYLYVFLDKGVTNRVSTDNTIRYHDELLI